MLACQALAVCWYATAGHHPADTEARRRNAPWYTTKAEPSTADMTAKLRRVIIAARFKRVCPDRGCRIALHGPVSTPNLRPEHGQMSGSGDHIVGGMCRMPDLTKPFAELCDSLSWDR